MLYGDCNSYFYILFYILNFVSKTGPLAITLLWVSIVCLLVHIFIHATLKKLRNTPAQILLALCCALAVAQFFVASLINYTASHSICIFVATCLHYFYLVASFWMNVLHFDLCRIAFKRTILNKVASTAREAKRAKVVYPYNSLASLRLFLIRPP